MRPKPSIFGAPALVEKRFNTHLFSDRLARNVHANDLCCATETSPEVTAAVVIDGQIDDGRAFRENLASGSKAADSRAQQMIEGTALIGPFLGRKAGALGKN